MDRKILIYDAKCTYSKGISSVFAQSDKQVRSIDWENSVVQDFLEEQFGRKPFAMMVVDDGTLYVGEEATRHLTQNIGIPNTVTEVVKHRAQPVSTIFSKLARRRQTDNIHGEFPINDEAATILEELSTEPVDIPIKEA